MRPFNELHACFRRNRLLIAVIAIAFFSILIVSGIVTYAILLRSPELIKGFQGVIGGSRAYIAIPPPYTNDLYRLIFLNNIGHFWNPARVWVWIPFVGAYSLGYELLLNAIVIGGFASFAGVTRGAMFAVAGLTPHGVFEIPAFILEFSGLARWHVAMTRTIYTKLSGGTIDRPLLAEELKDVLLLSLFSVVLFAVAAYVEAFITPRFLGL
jgi:uncharacterized membrane protein SpoIIM required for sporulation